MGMPRPIIGITCDTMQTPITGALADHGAQREPVARYQSPQGYARMVAWAGGVPILLPLDSSSLNEYLQLCDGFVLSGGDDPDTAALPEHWPAREPTHPQAVLIDPARQRFESLLVQALIQTDHPILGICLGMQWLALAAGGRLTQHLPDTIGREQAARHARTTHTLNHRLDHPLLPVGGEVYSSHHQAVSCTGSYLTLATGPGEVIEAIIDPDHPYRLGVQWHPEKTTTAELGIGLFQSLVRACSGDLDSSK